MALANNPDLLIADEPTTALDVTVQAQILKLLKDLQAETQMALLLITHDLGIVRHMADKVCVMQRGKIVEAGETEKVFDNPQHPYTKMLLAAEPKGKPPETDTSRPNRRQGRQGSKSGFRSSAASSGGWSGISRRSTASMSRSGPDRRSAWSANRARARPRSAWRSCVSSHRKDRSSIWASASTASMRAPCGHCARKCRSSFRIHTVRCRRACRSSRSSRKD